MKDTNIYHLMPKTLGHYLIVNLHYYYAIIWPLTLLLRSLLLYWEL